MSDWPPEYFERLIAQDRDRPALPPRDKPCEDCAVTCGLYTEISVALSEQSEDVQRAVSERWYCHNDPRLACRGNINLLATLRRKKQMERAVKG